MLRMQYIVFEKTRILIFSVLLERTHERSLLLVSLESSMTKLGGGVDELEVDHLQGSLLGVGQQGLPQGENPLLGTNATSFQHNEVLLNLSIVGETSHRVNRLV